MDKNETGAKQRRIGIFLLALSLAPWVNLVVWTEYALATRLALGHFPIPMTENRPLILDCFDATVEGTTILLAHAFVVFWCMIFGAPSRGAFVRYGGPS